MSQQIGIYIFLLSYPYSKIVNSFSDFRFIIYPKQTTQEINYKISNIY